MKMLLDLTGRGHIRLTGEDRARLLHAMTTQHIQQMQSGEWAYAFFLTAQGKIIADANVICRENHFILDTEPETHQLLLVHLERYIIADDATPEDLTARTAVLSVEGVEDFEVTGNAWKVKGLSATGLPAVRIFAPIEEREDLIRRIGIPVSELEEWNRVRIENAHPRYGPDICDQKIPHETGLMHAVHFTKGCYLGQEIVERVRSRGHVNRRMMQFLVEGAVPPAADTKLTSGGKEYGEITSAAYSPSQGKVVALGYLRVEAMKLPLDAGGAAVTVTEKTPY